jgi:hypothetical protein
MAKRDPGDFGSALADIFRESSWVMGVCLVLGMLTGVGVALWLVWSWPVLDTRAERRIQAVFIGGIVIAGLFLGALAGLVVGSLLDTLVSTLGKAVRPPRKRRRRRFPRRPPDEDDSHDDVRISRPLPPD